ncbi:MAG: aldolase/citrate lyase family protein [Pseudomonadota bacterium]
MTDAPINRLKARLVAGETTRGCWLNLRSDAATEIAGFSGADWCLIDAEHGPFDPGDVLQQIRVLAGTPADPVIRLPAAEAWMLKQALDFGAQTIMVPMIETAEAAAQVVAACRYPPAGIRGVGPSIARSGAYGARSNYVATADAQMCVVVQAESTRALDNIEAIAAVDGIDGIFIGPADLAADMQADAQKVAAAIDQGIARIAASGCAAGILASPDMCAHYEALGATMVAIATDTNVLRTGLSEIFG